MDPLTALSIAASTIQFVDFMSNLIATTNEIRKAESPADVAYLNARAADLISLNAGLRNRNRCLASNSSEIAEIEWVLRRMCSVVMFVHI